jgi:Protein of unknown function (DUF3370)
MLPIFSLAQIFIPLPSTPAIPFPLPSIDPPPVVAPIQRQVLQPQEVRALPGQLDAVPVINSNSPELVLSEGILLSTFPPTGRQVPSAHLNYPLQGRFDLFSHHIAQGRTVNDSRALYQGVLVYNPGNQPVHLDVLQGVSYMSQEAPFFNLPSYVANPMGGVFAGPGSRVMDDMLRGERQATLPARITIPPRRSEMLMMAPIPLRQPVNDLPPVVAGVATNQRLRSTTPISRPSTSTLPAVNPLPQNLTLPLNGRSTLMRLSSNGPVYVAAMAMFARPTETGGERAPTLVEWQMMLNRSGLAGPRDIAPTPPMSQNFSRFFYGRVAGVSQGSQWVAQLTDTPQTDSLSIPARGQQFSYALSTLDHGTLGTGQIQSAPMLARYSDTAYRANGNYGVLYDLTLPLVNHTDQHQTVGIMIQTPVKEEVLRGGLQFLEPPDNQIFFRGTVRIRYKDDMGITETRYIHVIQRRGQAGEPLIRFRMPPGDRRLTQIQFLYPPDSTPPQVLTVQTLVP